MRSVLAFFPSLQLCLDRIPNERWATVLRNQSVDARQRLGRQADLNRLHAKRRTSHATAIIGSLRLGQRHKTIPFSVDGVNAGVYINTIDYGDKHMARLAYFADLEDGSTLEFSARRVPTFVDRMGCQRYRTVEPKVQRCLPTDGSADRSTGNVLCGYIEGRGWTRITRIVQMKDNPSRHECDARCTNASGRTMNCECSCGGKNHGKGAFMCEAA